MQGLVDAVCIIAGVAVVAFVLDAAVRTFVVPRGSVVLFTVVVFRSIRKVFLLFASPRRGYEARDRVMAIYAPVALLALPLVSMIVVRSTVGRNCSTRGAPNSRFMNELAVI